jgi:ribulose-5-phosphate 4-epimerase/fuculose-1-phosphate aldolase
MANHGLIVPGATLRQALTVTDEVEEHAAAYLGTLATGGPVLPDVLKMRMSPPLFGSYSQGQRGQEGAWPSGGTGRAAS